MELQQAELCVLAGVLQFALVGLQRRQKLRQGIGLRNGLVQALAIGEVGLTA